MKAKSDISTGIDHINSFEVVEFYLEEKILFIIIIVYVTTFTFGSSFVVLIACL